MIFCSLILCRLIVPTFKTTPPLEVNKVAPEADFTGEGGPCPAGSYCEEGSASPTPCPAGTYTDDTGQVRVEYYIPIG